MVFGFDKRDGPRFGNALLLGERNGDPRGRTFAVVAVSSSSSEMRLIISPCLVFWKSSTSSCGSCLMGWIGLGDVLNGGIEPGEPGSSGSMACGREGCEAVCCEEDSSTGEGIR